MGTGCVCNEVFQDCSIEELEMFDIKMENEMVTARNLYSGATKQFEIKTVNCENGKRDYLVEVKERYRVRLRSRTGEGLRKAVKQYAEGYLDMVLSKHPL